MKCQYIMFCRILNEQMKCIKERRIAIKSTIDICKKDNVLREYLTKHEREVEDMLADLYDQDLISQRCSELLKNVIFHWTE